MTEERLPPAELPARSGDADVLRAVAAAVLRLPMEADVEGLRLPMEADVEGLIGAGRHERTGERQTCRNGFRDRTPDTRPGSPQLRVPKLRQGSHYPPFPG